MTFAHWYFLDLGQYNYFFSQKITFRISIKNWVDLCVFQISLITCFFVQKFSPGPLRNESKNKFNKNAVFIVLSSAFLHSTSILKVKNLFSTVKVTFWFNLFFDLFLRGTRAKFLDEKKSCQRHLKHA